MAKVISASLLLFLSSQASASVPSYDAKVSQAVATIVKTTPEGSQQRFDTIVVEAARIVGEMAWEDPDFTSSCGLNWDCYSFWTERTEYLLTEQAQIEDARKARCDQAKREYSTNNCGARDLNPPLNDYDVRFSFVPISSYTQYNYFRPIIREFHTQIFNDATGNTINNFASVLTQLRAACDANANIALLCKVDADNYFGQAFGGGLQSFLNAPGGQDAKYNLFGRVCNDIRERHSADQCGAWPT